MNLASDLRPARFRRFHTKLLLAMMLVISALTSLGIYVAQRRAASEARSALQHDFELEIATLHRLQDLRNAAVVDRSRSLAQNARIHAALEDNALDLLYPSAHEELRDLMERPGSAETLHARYYRFLDGEGAVLVPPNDAAAGALQPAEEAELSRQGLPQTMETGYLSRRDSTGRQAVDEIIVLPIRSSETNEVIAALVLGFRPVEATGRGSATGMRSGILVRDKLQLAGFDTAAEAQVCREVQRDLVRGSGEEHSLRVQIGSQSHLLFFKRLNPHSHYPAAYEVCVYPLQPLLARQRRLRLQILGGGGLLLLGGFVVSEIFSRRLSQPVEKLAVISEENFAQRRRAEVQLQTTAEELERSTRFSADASHQLKSPITVLRAGLDSLFTREGFPEEVYEEISSLVHQTYRLTGVIEDLLLLSRMDAGKLRLNLHTVDLTRLLEECVEDLQAAHETENLRIETEISPRLRIAGETHYTALVVQNLLDNARKYNRAGGVIRIEARSGNPRVEVRVANTGRGIPIEAQPYIFERFQRGSGREDVPGHGLGLNLACELVRLHGGELRLTRADSDWTEFTAVFLAATTAGNPSG